MWGARTAVSPRWAALTATPASPHTAGLPCFASETGRTWNSPWRVVAVRNDGRSVIDRRPEAIGRDSGGHLWTRRAAGSPMYAIGDPAPPDPCPASDGGPPSTRTSCGGVVALHRSGSVAHPSWSGRASIDRGRGSARHGAIGRVEDAEHPRHERVQPEDTRLERYMLLGDEARVADPRPRPRDRPIPGLIPELLGDAGRISRSRYCQSPRPNPRITLKPMRLRTADLVVRVERVVAQLDGEITALAAPGNGVCERRTSRCCYQYPRR